MLCFVVLWLHDSSMESLFIALFSHTLLGHSTSNVVMIRVSEVSLKDMVKSLVT